MGSKHGAGGNGFPMGGISDSGAGAFRGHSGRRPRVLAHGGQSFKRMVQDATHLYWTDAQDGTVTRLAKDGGVPLVLAANQQEPAGIAVEAGVLYWVNQRGGTVVRMAASGGDIAIIAANQADPECIAVAGRDVVWGNRGDVVSGTLMKGSTDGGAPVTLASDQKYPSAVAIDAAHIYWTTRGTKQTEYFTNGAVMSAPRQTSGDPKEHVAVAQHQRQPERITLDDEWLYWTTNGTVMESWWDASVMKRRKQGGEPIRLATKTRSADSLTLDATHVYWVESLQSSILRVSKLGGDPVQLLSSDKGMLLPSSLLVDETCLYWTVFDSRRAGGAIWKMAK